MKSLHYHGLSVTKIFILTINPQYVAKWNNSPKISILHGKSNVQCEHILTL